MNLKHFSNQNLLENTKKLSKEEIRITTEVLHHLKEIENRKLHLEMGYSSLFQYAVKELCYSEDAAYRRINAMKLIRNIPEVEAKIKEGHLSLTSAAKIQNLFKNQAKDKSKNQQKIPFSCESLASLKLDTNQDKLNWISTLEKKSTLEIEREIVKFNPQTLPQEKIRLVSEDKIELKIIIDEELKDQLDQLKDFLSHKNPNMNYQELIKHLAQIGLQKLDPSKKKTRRPISNNAMFPG